MNLSEKLLNLFSEGKTVLDLEGHSMFGDTEIHYDDDKNQYFGILKKRTGGQYRTAYYDRKEEVDRDLHKKARELLDAYKKKKEGDRNRMAKKRADAKKDEGVEAVAQSKKVQALQKKIYLLRNEINSKHNDPEAKKRFQDELHDAERRLRITRAA